LKVAGPPRRTAWVKARADGTRAAGHFEDEVPTVPNGTQCVGLDGPAARAACVLESPGADGPRTIVMGLDQHRAQITAEWIDTASGEIGRARVMSADRESVRRFLGRFRDRRLEVALEATTGWRFVVEELHAIGARAHLAEPAETSARRGNKKRAKTDRGDARHLRELLMIGRLPESSIPPAHLLDLRARVRFASHTLRSAWRVAAADPGGALSPRLPAAPIADDRRRAALAARPAAAGVRARAGRRRDRDGRRARGPDRPAG